jgi:hypothetical protein
MLASQNTPKHNNIQPRPLDPKEQKMVQGRETHDINKQRK